MKNNTNFNKYTEPDTCDLLTCLLGTSKVPVLNFRTIWQQMLPEAQVAQEVDSGNQMCSRPSDFINLNRKIREGP